MDSRCSGGKYLNAGGLGEEHEESSKDKGKRSDHEQSVPKLIHNRQEEDGGHGEHASKKGADGGCDSQA